MPEDPIGEYLHQALAPVSSKKRPAYEAAQDVRRMVAAELVDVLLAKQDEEFWCLPAAAFIDDWAESRDG